MDLNVARLSDQIYIEQYLLSCGVSFSLLEDTKAKMIVKKWDRVFAQKVKDTTGNWVHERYRWHAFSYDFAASKSGPSALSEYFGQWPAPFVLFNENLKWCYQCKADMYPDLTALCLDIYVSHHNMKWTMVFTHEQPHIGPFFATQ